MYYTIQYQKTLLKWLTQGKKSLGNLKTLMWCVLFSEEQVNLNWNPLEKQIQRLLSLQSFIGDELHLSMDEENSFGKIEVVLYSLLQCTKL